MALKFNMALGVQKSSFRRAPPVYQRSRRVTTPSATCSHKLKAHHLVRLFHLISFHHLTDNSTVDVSKDVPAYQRSRRAINPSTTCSHNLEAHHLDRLSY